VIATADSTTMVTSGDGHGPGQERQTVDDRKAGSGHRVDMPGDVDQLRQLRHEDEDRQRVDEARNHGARHETHQGAEVDKAGDDLQHAGEDTRRQQVLQPVLLHQRHHDQRHGTGRGGNHARPAAGKGDDDGDAEGRVKPDLRVHAGDDGEGDRLGYQGQGHHQTRQQVVADVAQPVLSQLPQHGE
jgi:hypothetical protein